jgi:hypothetical protein
VGKPKKMPGIVRGAMDLARAAIGRDGSLVPLLIFLDDKRKPNVAVVADLFADGINPGMRRVLLQAMLARLKATAYALAVEAWALITPEPEGGIGEGDEEVRAAAGLEPGQRVEDHPRRREIVAISYQDLLTGAARAWQAFTHCHGDEAWLGEFVEMQIRGGDMMGLFDGPGDYHNGRRAL